MVLAMERRKWSCESLPPSQLPAELIRNPDNRGFCAAKHQGFAASTSDLVALLNNDAEAEPDWLPALTTAFEDGREIGWPLPRSWFTRIRGASIKPAT